MQIESVLGAAVVDAQSQAGGFSPGVAARCRLDDGRGVFVKAVSPAQNALSCRFHRREAEVARQLPASCPSPRLRHVHDDGTWVVLVFDLVDGVQPDEPWTLDQLDVVIPRLVAFADAGTPSPVADLPTFAERHGAILDGWRRLAVGDGRVDALPPWAAARVEVLASIEADWEAATLGSTLLHADLRADNMLIDDDDRLWLVDWPLACTGARFVDLALMLPSIGLGGGPRPMTVIDRYDLFADVPQAALRSTVAAVSGFFARQAQEAPPPGLPRLRDFQRAQGDVALDWLRELVE